MYDQQVQQGYVIMTEPMMMMILTYFTQLENG
jgi:hypothetical protein